MLQQAKLFAFSREVCGCVHIKLKNRTPWNCFSGDFWLTNFYFLMAQVRLYTIKPEITGLMLNKP